MESRKGKSADYSAEERLRRFNLCQELRKENYSYGEIAAALEMTDSTFYSMRKSKWWKKMERNREIQRIYDAA